MCCVQKCVRVAVLAASSAAALATALADGVPAARSHLEDSANSTESELPVERGWSANESENATKLLDDDPLPLVENWTVGKLPNATELLGNDSLPLANITENVSAPCNVTVTDGDGEAAAREAPRLPPELAPALSFAYHKPALPLNWRHDGLTMVLASVGLIIAASGGIGGGGILVPVFMLVLQFRPKHAIALSNFTIFGGAIANTTLNSRKRHPRHPDRGIIDWDLIVIMEPLTIFGAVFGSLLSKVLPNLVLTTSLVIILALMGDRTLRKAVKMWQEESQSSARVGHSGVSVELVTKSYRNNVTTMECVAPSARPADDAEADQDRAYLELLSDGEGLYGEPGKATGRGAQTACSKISMLTACFVGTCALTVLKGGGDFKSPMGFACGSSGFWWLYFASLPWVLLFALYFRHLLVREFEQKVKGGYVFESGEVRWNAENTVKYPAICAVAGLFAGLFGVGGGIVKGPLMIEMGIAPSVASASAAAMILYTSAAASTSFIVFGLLHPSYGAIFFLLGFFCTAVGQYSIGKWVKKHQRQSPVVLSIGLVIALSSILIGVNTVYSSLGRSAGELFQAHGVCTSDA